MVAPGPCVVPPRERVPKMFGGRLQVSGNGAVNTLANELSRFVCLQLGGLSCQTKDEDRARRPTGTSR